MADSIAITTNANNTWLAELCGKDSVRWENILTIEIEKLWLSNKPILFVGFISDIKSTGTDYEIYINHDALFENFFTIEDFQLVLKSSKKQINELLNDKLQLIENQFIAIAKITKIENRKYLDFEGYEESDFIGFGELVKIVPIDVEKFREWGEKHNKQEKDSLYWEQYKIETTRPIIMNRDSFENDSLYWEQFKVE